MFLSAKSKCFAPPELESYLGSWFYKHLVPPGTEDSSDRTMDRLIRCEDLRDRMPVSISMIHHRG